MDDDRLRIQCEESYLQSLGLAVFAFARLEWTAVWCAEKLEPGCINRLPDRTAGKIAKRLRELAGRAPDGEQKSQLIGAATAFQVLVERRNDIFHAKPCEVLGGAQRLNRRGEVLTVQVIDAAADDFVGCEIVLNGLLHGYLDKSV